MQLRNRPVSLFVLHHRRNFLHLFTEEENISTSGERNEYSTILLWKYHDLTNNV